MHAFKCKYETEDKNKLKVYLKANQKILNFENIIFVYMEKNL